MEGGNKETTAYKNQRGVRGAGRVGGGRRKIYKKDLRNFLRGKKKNHTQLEKKTSNLAREVVFKKLKKVRGALKKEGKMGILQEEGDELGGKGKP